MDFKGGQIEWQDVRLDYSQLSCNVTTSLDLILYEDFVGF